MRLLLVLTAGLMLGDITARAGGPEKGGGTPDSLKASHVEANPIHLNTEPAFTITNPDEGKIAAWDTTDMDIYHQDMTMFTDTLVYEFGEQGMNFLMPVEGMITSGFGSRHLFGRSFHKGVDLDLETGDEVHAAMDGIVRIARYNRGYGNFVIISHKDGLETLYGHMSELKVERGQFVKAGELIGLGGSTGQSTGSHLHLEVRVFGKQIDPAQMIDYSTRKPIADKVEITAGHFRYGEDYVAKTLHVVKEGETLSSIATLYEIEETAIRELNELGEDPNVVIEVGQVLKMD